jgi:hypothetical protein
MAMMMLQHAGFYVESRVQDQWSAGRCHGVGLGETDARVYDV